MTRRDELLVHLGKCLEEDKGYLRLLLVELDNEPTLAQFAKCIERRVAESANFVRHLQEVLSAEA